MKWVRNFDKKDLQKGRHNGTHGKFLLEYFNNNLLINKKYDIFWDFDNFFLFIFLKCSKVSLASLWQQISNLLGLWEMASSGP